MDVRDETRSFESWLGRHVAVQTEDLERKHHKMARSTLDFLRGSFYLFLRRWARIGPDLLETPAVLALGDVHIANFGTWRDAEGRLAWGVNDFDEAHPAPYALDLVRLASSAIVAAGEGQLALGDDDLCDCVLGGYAEALERGGEAFVLAERHATLREMALESLKEPQPFWSELEAAQPWLGAVPAQAARLLAGALPPGSERPRHLQRIAGVGSLGQPRIVLLADWCGGLVAREAKMLRPPAAVWVEGKADGPMQGGRAAASAIRTADPLLTFGEGCVVRRLSPDCVRIEVADLPRRRDERRLLAAMGAEIANVHLGTPAVAASILSDLRVREGTWLRDAARRAAEIIESDARAWRKG